IFGVADEYADATASGRSALDGGHAAEQGFEFAVLNHFAKEGLLQVVVGLLEFFIGGRSLPLGATLIKLWRIPFGQEVVGDVIVSVDEAWKDVSVGNGDHGGAGRLSASGGDAGDGVVFNDQHAVQRSVGVDDGALEDEFGRIGPGVNGGLRAG